MTLKAGEINRASEYNTRVATATATSDGSDYTATETELLSATADLVNGETYKVSYCLRIGTDNSGDTAVVRLREDDTTGTEMTVDYLPLPNAGTVGNLITCWTQYTAAATASKTFVATGLRGGGSGTHHLEAATNRPAWLTVELIHEA